MKLVIEISEDTFCDLKKKQNRTEVDNAILNGTTVVTYPETNYCLNTILELPPVTRLSKTGHWIYELEDWNRWTCSECGWSERTDVHITLGYNYCPNCGAKMESVRNKNENR